MHIGAVPACMSVWYVSCPGTGVAEVVSGHAGSLIWMLDHWNSLSPIGPLIKWLKQQNGGREFRLGFLTGIGAFRLSPRCACSHGFSLLPGLNSSCSHPVQGEGAPLWADKFMSGRFFLMGVLLWYPSVVFGELESLRTAEQNRRSSKYQQQFVVMQRQSLPS